MQTINFYNELVSTVQAQNLKDELDIVGVKAFVINYETQQIFIVNPDNIENVELACAVRRAGFKCSCFKVCNHVND
jgi:hypothetical protein